MQSSNRGRMRRKATDYEIARRRDIRRRLARRLSYCTAGNNCRFPNCRCTPAALGDERLNRRRRIVFDFESRLLPVKAGAQACLSATGA